MITCPNKIQIDYRMYPCERIHDGVQHLSHFVQFEGHEIVWKTE